MLKNKNILYPELSYKLNKLFFETHNNLGRYRNKKQYADYFEKLLKEEGIGYLREYVLPSLFDGERKRRNVIDFIIDNKIIIEFKTETIITKDDYFQIQRYLVSANKELGIIVNFRQVSIKPKRVLNASMFKK
ncbi:MAG: GxxExxY protein [Patescibacteria group bacterium]|nr:GxxExxY protein [Patescibacteria group bacterium]